MGYSINELQVGQQDSFSKTITETDIYLFAGITGDFNPAHVNEEGAKDTLFGGRIAHGMLSAGLVSTVLGMKLPGPGTIYMGQTLNFTAPVHIHDTVTATVEVAELDKEKNIAILRTYCKNQNGKTVLEGLATVRPEKHSENGSAGPMEETEAQ